MSFLNLARSVHQAISIYTDTIDGAKVTYGEGLIKDGLIKDRFRGVVVGLWMVPTALFSTPRAISCTNDFDRSYREKPGRDWFASIDNQETLALAITHRLDELNAFLCSPHRARSPLTGPHCALSSLPLLLRYHSDARRRSHALLELTVRQEPKQATQRLAQQLILGDVLSMAFGVTDPHASTALSLTSTKVSNLGQPRLSLTAAAMSELDASNYGLSSLQYRCYRDLWQSLEEHMLQGTAASNSVIEGIAIALSWPNHYPTALQNARSYIQSTYIGRGDFVSALVESVIVTSVICGALGGRQSLPVLWQLQPYADQAQANSRYENASGRIGSKPQKWPLQSAVELADRLFAQWRGQWRGQ